MPHDAAEQKAGVSGTEQQPDQQPARSGVARFAGQVGWSLGAKIWSAVLQLVTLVLLARGLAPAQFAWVASVSVVMTAVTATNGFGLMRQIQYRRSVRPDDPLLPELFDLRLRFTYGSALVWLVACLALAPLLDDGRYLAVVPIALWLALDQTIVVWNAISIVDGRNQDLLPSYTWRRLPVVVALLIGAGAGWDPIWVWSIGLTLGTTMAFVVARRRQVGWARHLRPRPRTSSERLELDLGFWWAEIGAQIRDLDVTVVTAVSASVGGAFALPARLVKPMNIITLAAASVAFPRLARRKTVTVRQVFLGALVGTAPVTVIAIGLALLAPLLPRIVGEEYDGTIGPLRILCLAAVISGYIAVLAVFLQSRSTESTKHAGYALLAFGLLQIAGAGVGATLGGAEGAAWSAVISQALLVGVLWVATVHRCRIEQATAAAEPSQEVTS